MRKANGSMGTPFQVVATSSIKSLLFKQSGYVFFKTDVTSIISSNICSTNLSLPYAYKSYSGTLSCVEGHNSHIYYMTFRTHLLLLKIFYYLQQQLLLWNMNKLQKQYFHIQIHLIFLLRILNQALIWRQSTTFSPSFHTAVIVLKEKQPEVAPPTWTHSSRSIFSSSWQF